MTKDQNTTFGYIDEKCKTFRLCQKINRSALGLVDKWIEDSVYDASIFKYGLPQSVRHFVDLPQRSDATYSDVILYHSLTFKCPIRYLEIGVFVGKNFLQMINGLDNAFVCGFDIEDISPVLLNFLNKTEQNSWETAPNSQRKINSTKTTYKSLISENNVQYIAGDVFDEKSWSYLPKDFNIIFSDAFHTGEALLEEWRLMIAHNIFADEFTMFWDDLDNIDMISAFWSIYMSSREIFPNKRIHASIQKFDGWLGGNEHKHGVGCLIVRSSV